MLAQLRDAVIASVRRRVEQGDCPTEPAHSVETLENVILDLATPSQGLDAATVERVRAATAKMRARAGANPTIAEGLSVTLSVADAEAILAALATEPHQHGSKDNG